MKKLTKNQAVAVFSSLALMTYLFYSGPLMSLFGMDNSNNSDNQNTTPMPETGFVSREVVVGQGAVATAGDRLTVHYVGTLPGGRVFDSSLDRNAPIVFVVGVGQVIKGWDEGVVGMREGGKRVLTIAPDYGYGAQSVGTIPSNSTLIFEVELLKVEKPITQ